MGTEVIDLIHDYLTPEEFRGYCKGNILKYRLRAGHKGDATEDIAKAKQYERWHDLYGEYDIPTEIVEVD
jgi:hypothetical protein